MKPGIKKTLYLLTAFILTVIAVLIILSIWLKAYTRHDKAILVPDVTYLGMEEAAASLKSCQLRFEIIDSIRNDRHPAGVVLEQRPSPGSKVKENRRVYLTVNSQEEKYMTVPAVKDNSQRQAISTLQAVGFKVAHVQYVPSQYRDLVLDVQYQGQSIASGTSLPMHSALTLVVGQGNNNEKVSIPDLIGKSLDSAIIIAHENSVNIGEIRYDEEPTRKNSAEYFVYMQDPVPAMHYSVGKRIDIWMSRNRDMLLPADSLLNEDIDLDF